MFYLPLLKGDYHAALQAGDELLTRHVLKSTSRPNDVKILMANAQNVVRGDMSCNDADVAIRTQLKKLRATE